VGRQHNLAIGGQDLCVRISTPCQLALSTPCQGSRQLSRLRPSRKLGAASKFATSAAEASSEMAATFPYRWPTIRQSSGTGAERLGGKDGGTQVSATLEAACNPPHGGYGCGCGGSSCGAGDARGCCDRTSSFDGARLAHDHRASDHERQTSTSSLHGAPGALVSGSFGSPRVKLEFVVTPYERMREDVMNHLPLSRRTILR